MQHSFPLKTIETTNAISNKIITILFHLCFINIKNREVSRQHRGKGIASLPQRVFKLLYPPVRFNERWVLYIIPRHS